MALLEVAELDVNYGPLAAVRGLSLELEESQVAVILGTNGAGKTTTLNAISGAVRARSGTVSFDGRNVTNSAPWKISRSGLGHVPEGRRIVGPLTVEENLLVGAYNVRSRGRRSELIDDVFDTFPMLAEKRDELGGLLSGGQQQMLALGRALMAEPRALLMDEPSMGLAPIMVQHVMDAVQTIAARGIAVLMVEQNATAAFRVATEVYLIEHGEVILHGPVDQVQNSELVRRSFLGI
ncbi:ABC transporter ATP-binding protein [Agrococcus baldri]|uniref:ABC transporter ATP-binding protein n=1 Tax=Agrococcus baldri TaxID=153730 RepID=A0AA87UW42_9MICO|nr:ABC transporter ATP-binding protein [Agrococcus baldri]GEK79112.1 ABC transporter ATP-binding protein [Agrococcus baldri]